jgi:hypothetical protein
VRRALPAILLALVSGITCADGDAHVVQKFDGVDTNTSTATFTVQDKWEVLWFSPRPLDITLLSSDGTVITGVHGSFRGSFYQPKGGTYYFQLNSNRPEMRVPWHLVVAEVGSGTSLSQEDAGPMFSNPNDPPYTPPASILQPGAVAQTPPGSSPSPNYPGMPSNFPGQFPSPQANAVTPQTTSQVTQPTPPVTPAPVVKLTEDQARAVVLIKGDNAEGTGFLIKTMDGPVVVTNIHVIANNPNLKITTNTGAFITVLSEKGASDRDLALLAVQDAGYSYLEMAPDISKVVQPGDDVITPGNSQGGEVMLNTAGKVLGIGPERIEIDNPIYHGNSGGPVFHVKSSKVLGVVTEAVKVDVSNDLDKASFASRNSAISGSMRYFALRMDTVVAWIPIDSRRFQIETTFLDQFDLRNRALDSFLNAPDDNKPEDTVWKQDDKIVRANNTYFDQASGGDASQQMDATRGLDVELNDIADADMDVIRNSNNFYGFDQERARDEIDYRNALKSELNKISSDVSRLGGLPRTNNNSGQ